MRERGNGSSVRDVAKTCIVLQSISTHRKARNIFAVNHVRQFGEIKSLAERAMRHGDMVGGHIETS